MSEGTIVSEFQKQEKRFLDEVPVKIRKSIKEMITKYDLSHSLLKITVDNMRDYDRLKLELQKALLNRELYIKNLIEDLVCA
jgi:hypothetical protein